MMGKVTVMAWGFLTNHAQALLCIAQDPGVRLREIASTLGITERSASSPTSCNPDTCSRSNTAAATATGSKSTNRCRRLSCASGPSANYWTYSPTPKKAPTTTPEGWKPTASPHRHRTLHADHPVIRPEIPRSPRSPMTARVPSSKSLRQPAPTRRSAWHGPGTRPPARHLGNGQS